MSVRGYFSKRQPTTHADKYCATRDHYDPVLRAHLRLKPPEPEATCPYTGKVKVNGEWMTKDEYRSRYPDFSVTP